MSVANESHQEEQNMKHEAHSGPARYWLVWAALLVLTLVTVLTGKMHLPGIALGLALFIATTKGLMVLLFFMHLIDHKGANRLVMGVSVLFVLMMLAMPMADLATRFRPSNPAGSHLSDLPDLNFIEGKSPAGGAHGGGHGTGAAPGGHPAPGGHEAPSEH